MYRYLTTLQHFAPHIYYGRCHNITGFLCQNHYSTRNRSKRPQSTVATHLATVRYGKALTPTASTNSLWHSLAFLPRRTAILI